MKLVAAFVFFILCSMIVEDCLSGHAAAEDLSTPRLLHFLTEDHHHSPISEDCDTSTNRSASHFGHCSFLLIQPSLAPEIICGTPAVLSNYFFSLKLGQQSLLLRPPIS